MSRLSRPTMRQMNRICETRRSVGVGGLLTEVLAAPGRADHPQALELTPFKVSSGERGCRPAPSRPFAQVLTRKIPPLERSRGLHYRYLDCPCFSDQVAAAKRFNRDIEGSSRRFAADRDRSLLWMYPRIDPRMRDLPYIHSVPRSLSILVRVRVGDGGRVIRTAPSRINLSICDLQFPRAASSSAIAI
jgi:hypothetical protein